MYYISASLFQRLLSFTSEKGIKTNELLKKANVSESILLDKEERIPLEIYYAIMDAAIEMTEDNYFGLHMGESAGLGNISILGYIMASCRTVREALEKVCKYFAIIGSTQRHSFIIEKDSARLTWETIKCFPNICIKHCIESGLANTCNMLRNMAVCPVEIKEVWINSGPPDNMSEYSRVFNCPVMFNKPKAAIVFPLSALDVPLKYPNPALLSLLERYAKSFLDRIDKEDYFSRKIGIMIFETIPGDMPTIEKIAKELGMSKRALQSKLKGEGTTYSELTKRVRTDLAKSYLVENRYTIDDVAYLLGFSTPAAFHRAFKNWTGITAGHYQSDSKKNK